MGQNIWILPITISSDTWTKIFTKKTSNDKGKEIIRKIIHITHRSDIRSQVVFIEDYDMCIIIRDLIAKIEVTKMLLNVLKPQP